MQKILVADDSPDILRIGSMILEAEGFDVTTTEDPFQVVPMLEEGHYDLVVLDVMMPGLTGWYLLHLIRHHWELSELPIVMLTALDGDTHRERAQRAGADDYVSKPFEPEELVLRLKAAVAVGEARLAAREAGLRESYALRKVA